MCGSYIKTSQYIVQKYRVSATDEATTVATISNEIYSANSASSAQTVLAEQKENKASAFY